MRAMVPPRLVPASPHTNTLYPGAESSTPIFSARSARSCPMKPSRSSACAGGSNGVSESSHLHLSFAAGSSVGFGAGLVVMKILRARYSSTLKSCPHGETIYVLSSGYRRAFRAFHIYGQDSRGGGHQDRPQHQTEHPKETDAANHTDEDHQAAQFGAPTEQQRTQDIVHNRGDARADRQQQNGAPPMPREAEPQRRRHEDQ